MPVFPKTIIHSVIVIAFGLAPILFLPITQDFYATPQWTVLILAAAIILCIAGIRLLYGPPPAHLVVPRITMWFGLLAATTTISLLASSTNRIEAITHPLGPATYASLTILLIASHGMTNRVKNILEWLLHSCASILGIIAIYQFFGMGNIMFPAIPFLQDPLWTPTGTTVSTIAILFICLSMILPRIVRAIQKPHPHTSIEFLVLSGIISTAGLGCILWQSIPKFSASLMPFSVGLPMTLELLKNPHNALFGVGAENIVSAFTKSKPFWLMSTPLWNVRFFVSADFFLHVTNVFGLFGLIPTILLAQSLVSHPKEPLFLTRCVALATLLLIPPSIPALAVITAVCILAQDTHGTGYRIPTNTFLRYTGGVFSLLAGIAVFYFLSQFFLAELYYMNGLRASQKNEGTLTYNSLIRAIQTDYYLSRYHITYSQTSLSLANSIAAGATDGSKNSDVTRAEADRKLAGQLVQQAISEAKIAVTLSPKNIIAWENLATVYQVLMPIARDADTWADATYKKALSLDPTNPVLLVNLGGVLIHEKKYDDAIAAFNQAIFIRDDYANAYYNLANAQKLKGDNNAAIATLTKTMTLIAPDSADYVKVKNELESLGGTPPVTPTSTSDVSGQSQLTLPQ